MYDVKARWGCEKSEPGATTELYGGQVPQNHILMQGKVKNKKRNSKWQEIKTIISSELLKNPPTLPSSSQGRAAPGTTLGVELCLQNHPAQRPLKPFKALLKPLRVLQQLALASWPALPCSVQWLFQLQSLGCRALSWKPFSHWIIQNFPGGFPPCPPNSFAPFPAAPSGLPSFQWPFHLQGCPDRPLSYAFLRPGFEALLRDLLTAFSYGSLQMAVRCNLWTSLGRGFAQSFFLRFRDCRLAPPKALHPSLRPGLCWELFLAVPRLPPGPPKSPSPFPAPGALLRALSCEPRLPPAPPKALHPSLRPGLCWELFLAGPKLPPGPPKSPSPFPAPGALLRALSCGSETAAWPPQKPFTLPCARGFAESSFLRFRDCRLAPPKALHPSLRPGLCWELFLAGPKLPPGPPKSPSPFPAPGALLRALSCGSETGGSTPKSFEFHTHEG